MQVLSSNRPIFSGMDPGEKVAGFLGRRPIFIRGSYSYLSLVCLFLFQLLVLGAHAATFDPGRKDLYGTVQVVSLYGSSPFQMGRTYGVLMQDELKVAYGVVEKQTRPNPSLQGKKVPPFVSRMTQGIMDGAGLTFEQAMRLQEQDQSLNFMVTVFHQLDQPPVAMVSLPGQIVCYLCFDVSGSILVNELEESLIIFDPKTHVLSFGGKDPISIQMDKVFAELPQSTVALALRYFPSLIPELPYEDPDALFGRPSTPSFTSSKQRQLAKKGEI